MHHDPYWLRASQWLAMNRPGGLGIVDVPINQSITPGRCDLAPSAIREALAFYSTYDCETGADLMQLPTCDFGTDLNRAVEESRKVVLLGGDNGATFQGVSALKSESVGVITLDLHLDVRHTEHGPNNGNPIRRLIESGVPGQNIVQIGIMGMVNSMPYHEFVKEHQVRVITMSQVQSNGVHACFVSALKALELEVDQIYLDFDLDVMDRAFVPGCPGARPGGLSPNELKSVVYEAGAHRKVVAMDLVEFDPTKDHNNQTALVAALMLLTFASGMSSNL